MKLIFSVLLCLISIECSFGQFSDAEYIAGGSRGTRDVFNVDIDGDGLTDIAATSRLENKIGWFKNLGNGEFSGFRIIHQDYGNPSDVFCGDIDGDGDIDVVSTIVSMDEVLWFENIGSGKFAVEQMLTNQLNDATGVYCDDINNDGLMDIIAMSQSPSIIVRFLNLGGGVFESQYTIATAQIGLTNIILEDIDQDGDVDLIASLQNSVRWFVNQGQGNFTSWNEITVPPDVYASRVDDINNDGELDIVAASTNGVFWVENLGGGVFAAANLIYAIDDPTDVFSEDVDNDGWIDVMSTSDGDDLVVWSKNLGGGIFALADTISSSLLKPFSIISSDFDNDGDNDVVVASYDDDKITYFEFTGLSFSSNRIISPQVMVYHSHVEDLNDDGLKDVLVASGSSVRWFENLGLGEFGTYQTITDLTQVARSVHSDDLDGDGDMDVLVSDWQTDEVLWYENLGGGNFGPAQVISSTFPGPSSISSGDMDGDGDIDVVITTGSINTVLWIRNLGNGSFASPVSLQVLSFQNTRDCYVSDLDGDGDNDILVGHSDNIVWWSNNGGGNFFLMPSIATGLGGMMEVFSKDLDGDGDLDILAGYGWYENYGSGVFGPEQAIVGMDTESAYSSDLDNDGDNDVISTNSGGDSLSWYENNGSGIFGGANVLTAPPAAWSLVSGVRSADFDLDGDEDVIFFAWESEIGWQENFYNSPYQAKGKLYLDENQNGIRDSLEIGLSQIMVNSLPAESQSFAYTNGDYFLNYVDSSSGTYLITPSLSSYWGITSDSLSYTVSMSPMVNMHDSLDFGYYPLIIADSISTSLVGGFAQCTNTVNYWINIGNLGTSIPSGSIHLVLDDSVTYVSSSITPDSIIGQNIYFSFDSLYYFDQEVIELYVTMPDFNSIGDTLTSYLETNVLDSLGNVAYTVSDTLDPILTCAYDPNDKLSDPNGFDSLGYIDPNTSYLDYTVRFQNTGNDTASVVIIKDVLDTNLIISSFTVLASSDDLNVDFEPLREVVFTFPNINLPDSNANFLGSQGFVKYRIYIDPATPIGTSMYNQANIFFDQNPPVETNLKINTLYDCTFEDDGIQDTMYICYNEDLNISHDLSSSIYNWTIQGVTSGVGNEINWTANTAGVFVMNISRSNVYCSIDTTITLVSLAQIPINQLPSQGVCFGDSALIFGNYINVSGVYTNTAQTIHGCDSILQIEVIAYPQTAVTQLGSQQICSGDSVLFGSQYLSSPGWYYDTLTSVYGCDSIISIGVMTLSVPSVSNGLSDTLFFCVDDPLMILDSESPSGGLYLGSGVTGNEFDPQGAGLGTHPVLYSYTAVNGCVNSDNSIFVVSGPQNVSIGLSDTIVLCINSSSFILDSESPLGGGYSGTGIVGNEFSPQLAGLGSHTVYYDYAGLGCPRSDSTVFVIDGCIGVQELESNGIKIYPNPFKDYTMIQFGNNFQGNYSIEVYNSLGELVIEEKSISEPNYKLERGNLAPGEYSIRVLDGESTIVLNSKLIIQ